MSQHNQDLLNQLIADLQALNDNIDDFKQRDILQQALDILGTVDLK